MPLYSFQAKKLLAPTKITKTLKAMQALVIAARSQRQIPLLVKETFMTMGLSSRGHVISSLYFNGLEPDNCHSFSFPWQVSLCQTGDKPYGIVVSACLATAKHLLGDALTVDSDGGPASFTAGVEFARDVLHLQIKNPLLHEAHAHEHRRSR